MMLKPYALYRSFHGLLTPLLNGPSRKLVFASCLALASTLTHYSHAKDDSYAGKEIPPASAQSETAAAGCHGTVLLLGDSIGAGYGLGPGESWADLLGKQLQQQGLNWVNASVSGETSAGGLRRIEQLLKHHKPSWLILELGGNDGLRGYPIKQMQTNLQAIVNKAQQVGAKVFVLGMRIPPNYGPRYTQLFYASYRHVAEASDSAYLAFLLEGIGDKSEMMQADGIHPNAIAQPAILATVTAAMPKFCSRSVAN